MGVEAWGVRRRSPAPPRRPGGHRRETTIADAGNRHQRRTLRWSSPDQSPGTVVIPSVVADERGTTHACDPAVVAALERAAHYLRLPVAGGSLVSTAGMVTGPSRELWAERGHVAVDMESAAAAESAQRFGVLRVILDTPTRELSGAWATPARAIRQPSNWGEAIWLGLHAPRYALRVGAVLEAAFLGNVDPEI